MLDNRLRESFLYVKDEYKNILTILEWIGILVQNCRRTAEREEEQWKEMEVSA